MTSRLIPLLLLGVALAASGCVSTELGHLRDDMAADLERQPGVEVNEFGTNMSFGRVSLGIARRAATSDMDDDASAELVRRLLTGVRSVKVAHYPIRGLVDASTVGTPATLRDYEARGWLPVVVVRDSASSAWLMMRESDDGLTITDLLAVALTPAELAFAKISGDLTGVALDALALADEDGMFQDALASAGLADDEPEADPASPGPSD